MIFNSVTFCVFLLISVVLYWILPNRLRIWYVFLSGLVFYGFWKVEFIPLMLFTAFLDYFVALKIENLNPSLKRKRFRWLLLSFIANFGLLIYFKYLLFFTNNLNDLFLLIGWEVNIPLMKIILPLGISFYTFESVCYTVDVYRGHLKANKDWVLYGSFITFFPKLIAGPILRASEILDQIKTRVAFKYSYIVDGLIRILLGLCLKVVLADNISPLVDEVYTGNYSFYSAIDVWTMAFLFGFQIYFDFSAYSHIAIGCGKMLGINISENFNYPYIATSFKDFWKRWHISLSSWIRDYLYLPLTGQKVIEKSTGNTRDINENDLEVSTARKNRALFITWSIMGLWHGANWTFLVWGLYHAALIFSERKLVFIRNLFGKKYPAILGWVVTFPLAMLSWIPFRAQNLTETFSLYSKVINPLNYNFISLRENVYLITFLILILFLFNYFYTFKIESIIKKHLVLDSVISVFKLTLVIILTITFLRPISQFIYFQF